MATSNHVPVGLARTEYRLSGLTPQQLLAELAKRIALRFSIVKFSNFDFAGWAEKAWASSDNTRWFETVKIDGDLFTLAVRFDRLGTTVTDLGLEEEWDISLLELFPSLQPL